MPCLDSQRFMVKGIYLYAVYIGHNLQYACVIFTSKCNYSNGSIVMWIKYNFEVSMLCKL